MKITVKNPLTSQLSLPGLGTIPTGDTQSFTVKSAVYENVIEGLNELSTAGSITLTLDEDSTVDDTMEFATIQEITDAVTTSNDVFRAGMDGRLLVARCATAGNIALTGNVVVDTSITTAAGDIVLVKNQGTGTQNGLYVASASAWSRMVDADGNTVVRPGVLVLSLVGTANAMKLWVCDEETIDIGVTDITFTAVDATTLAADLVSVANTKGASMVGVEDAATRFTGTDVEACLAECATTAELVSVANALGASLVGVEDAATRFTGTDVEACLAECSTLAEMASVANALGASLVGVEDAAVRFTGADVEACLAETLVLGDMGTVLVTTGAEGSAVANAFDVVCQLEDVLGTNIAEVREVLVRSYAVTANEGDLAAAGAAVGTLNKANNPATGPNEAWFSTSAGGAFSFRCTDTVAEVCLVEIYAEGCRPKLLKLTYA
jgi:hypothetical protein